MPVTMFSPGYEEENKTKPPLVLKLEEADGGLTPQKAAEGLYEGAVPPPLFLTKGLIASIYMQA
jgi:3-dehydrosphinganine reductase